MGIKISDIAALRLAVLNKLVTKFMRPPNLILSKVFPDRDYESDLVEWESQIGSRGLTPFSSEEVEAPHAAIPGVGENSFKAAFWKEKTFFGVAFLNNIRKPGTDRRYQKAKRTLGNQVRNLSNREFRRAEWMRAQMLCGDGFTYKDKNGQYITIEYGIPDDQKVVLLSDYNWRDGTKRNIVKNISDAKIKVSNENSAQLGHAIYTAEVEQLMVLDPSIQTLLQKSSFGDGDLFKDPPGVLGSLLGLKMHRYDEAYQVRAHLMSVLPAGAGPHTISVDKTVDFVVGGVLMVFHVETRKKDRLTITAIDTNAGTITATGTLTRAYRASQDFVYMTRKFIPTNKFVMWADNVEGEPIGEFMLAPHELDRRWGQQVDRWTVKDPDGIFVRVENKGLPVLYHEDAIYQLKVE